ncbi:TniQ family protein [Thalassococcus sp. S3]|uniref:TniQ family protein n=1 Tax=Thalassococcus sp. S3 TaxID=2017482 RepID=UPI0020C220C2|nr:TniQ family protein [Thalassococcus sp. S3]
MTVSVRLSVAPRPFRNELLSFWTVRVAARYGLDVPDMTTWLAGQGSGIPSHRLIDDIAPDPDLLWLWARACRIDPARLTRLSLAFHYPDRAPAWTLERSEAPVCLACFDEDRARGRDSYLRFAWRLAEHLVCPAHRQMLHDRWPGLQRSAASAFSVLERLAAPVLQQVWQFANQQGRGAGSQF